MNDRQAEWCARCKELAMRSDPLTPEEEAEHHQKVAEQKARDEGAPDLFHEGRGGR